MGEAGQLKDHNSIIQWSGGMMRVGRRVLSVFALVLFSAASVAAQSAQLATFEHSLYRIGYPPLWTVNGNANSDVVIAPQDGMVGGKLRRGVLIKTMPRKNAQAPFSAKDYVDACSLLQLDRAIGGSGDNPDNVTLSGRQGFFGSEGEAGTDELEWVLVFLERNDTMLTVMLRAPTTAQQVDSGDFDPVLRAMLKSLMLK
jgi:hypothetical protein